MAKRIEGIKNVKWINIVIFYAVACGLTYWFRTFPNFLREISLKLFDFDAPFNYNHGIALLITSLAAYKLLKVDRRTTVFGNNPLKAVVFAIIFLVAYTAMGFSNESGVNKHLWALLFCLLILVYDMLEEIAWRGFLNDSLSSIPFWLKGIITGILWGLWHLLIFDNFNQFGGLYAFILFSIVLSIIMAYVTEKTNSILVAASIHALLCRTNYVTLICAVIWILIIITWKKNLLRLKKATS